LRFLVDANLSPTVAARLRSSGHDVTHVGDEGLLTADDQTILAQTVLLRTLLGANPEALHCRAGL